MAIEIETSTDTVEQVKEALGATVEIEESPAEEETEQPEEKPSAKGAEEEPEADENEEAAKEEDESEPEEEAETPKPGKKKPVPDMVPRSRLNEEIRKRKTAEALLSTRDEEEADEPEEEPEGTEQPQYFSGKPEPNLDDYLKGVDEFDAKAMSHATAKFAKEHAAWAREEARAEADYNQQVKEATEARQALVADFIERRDAFAETDEEYMELVPKSQVNLSGLMEHFVYESEVGPQILLHFAKNPKEAKRIGALKARSQSKAMLELEDELIAEYSTDDGKKKETPGAPKKAAAAAPPPRKPSAAPAPATRIKSAGPQPQTERELAGPVDRVGVDIEYNPELERRDKARKKA